MRSLLICLAKGGRDFYEKNVKRGHFFKTMVMYCQHLTLTPEIYAKWARAKILSEESDIKLRDCLKIEHLREREGYIYGAHGVTPGNDAATSVQTSAVNQIEEEKKGDDGQEESKDPIGQAAQEKNVIPYHDQLFSHMVLSLEQPMMIGQISDIVRGHMRSGRNQQTIRFNHINLADLQFYKDPPPPRKVLYYSDSDSDGNYGNPLYEEPGP